MEQLSLPAKRNPHSGGPTNQKLLVETKHLWGLFQQGARKQGPPDEKEKV